MEKYTLLETISKAAIPRCCFYVTIWMALDTEFGLAGRVLLTISASAWSYCYDMILQPDGKILIAGELFMISMALLSL